MAVILLSGCLRQFKTTFKGAGGWIKQLFELRLKIIQKNQLEKFHFSWDGGCLWTANINWCNLCRLQATASVNEFFFFLLLLLKAATSTKTIKTKKSSGCLTDACNNWERLKPDKHKWREGEIPNFGIFGSFILSHFSSRLWRPLKGCETRGGKMERKDEKQMKAPITCVLVKTLSTSPWDPHFFPFAKVSHSSKCPSCILLPVWNFPNLLFPLWRIKAVQITTCWLKQHSVITNAPL